ncbi:phosphatidate cytidylyltransferase [Mycoplasmopsis gallinarum]
MNLLKRRIIPGLLFAIFLFATLIPVSIFAPFHYQARIVAFLFGFTILSILLYELFNANRLKKYFSIPLALITTSLMFFPLNAFELHILNTSNLSSIQKIQNGSNQFQELSKTMKLIGADWQSLIIILTVSLIFFAIELQTKINISWKDRLSRVFILFISIYILQISIKFFYFSILLNYWYWLIMIITAVVSDVGGFIGGKLFSKKWINKPFAPAISPKKTWEGFIFSISFGIIVTSGLIFGLDLFPHNIALKTLFVAFGTLLAVVGDLYFSYLKRMNGIKDYSKILLDHGGVLDRYDSVSFVGLFMFILLVFA